jgi:phosphatidylinositol-3-phosphatase
MKRFVFALIALVTLTAASISSTADARTRPAAPHVWVIVLENKSYEKTFGPASPAPYLSQTLTSQGVLLRQYYGTGHFSLDNYITMMSGQAPNPQTQDDCQYYNDFVSPNGGALDANGQALGSGCVYPKTVLSFADQLDANHVSWKGYMEDMGTPCRHPDLNSQDGTQQAKVGDQYAARHNPFVYFHTIIDDPARCQAHVVDLQTNLQHDLARVSDTPKFSFITPNLCDDGHDAPCVDGRPGGLVSSDAFLQTWVPRITGSPAFKKDGVLIVMFDESDAIPQPDTRVCCHEPSGPNTPSPGQTGPGGGLMGAVVLSRWTSPGTVSDEPYNHYSLLRTLEDWFDSSHLGYAAQPGLQSFGRDVFALGRPS